ncbi:NAD(P)H-dependent oxidoreductase subunit E [Motiliproteus sp. MSK22-1]|uniref:NAD(P)H-dependent oxidoreductase subunit E n=1 Tax=Motiliproteus sp. MSK22-1 TaxID=1897630 RepID=UPI001300F381|nr:NAD(P)H-dependent oxidoreductase subunit E [Motiliproteus sp. MSK22-1]
MSVKRFLDPDQILPAGPWALPAAKERTVKSTGTQLPSHPSKKLTTPLYVKSVCQHYGFSKLFLLQALIRIQLRFGWVSPLAVRELSCQLKITGGEVRSIIDFYSFLSAEFQGQYQILLSNNITDTFLGQSDIFQQLCYLLKTPDGALREDSLVSVTMTSCTGLCDQGPAALINGHPIVNLTSERIKQIAILIESRASFNQWPQDWFLVSDNIREPGALLDRTVSPGQALSQVIKHSKESFLDELQTSSLRGRGGAGFSTFLKFSGVIQQNSKRSKYVICNADEGEPGTFKDRVLLQRHCQQVFEGMTIAGWALGAHKGIVYLRAEYAWLFKFLQDQLQTRRAQGWLGHNAKNLAGFSFDISIHLGAGAYICGEETALIESLEGKRGVPRIRPPFPAQSGYLGFPTLLNNVESFACITEIALTSGQKFAAIGTEHSKGTKLHSVSGDCKYPGIYELPWGVSIAEVLERCGAEDALAVQIGGPSGACIPRDHFDRCIAFEDVPTGGSFMVIGHSRSLIDVVTNFTDFFAHESCGFCTPCRVGCKQLDLFTARLKQRRIHAHELAKIKSLGELMINSSHCGLGKTAALPLLQLMESYPKLIEDSCIPATELLLEPECH